MRTEKEYSKLENRINKHQKHESRLQNKIRDLESELSQSVEREKKLRECVEFYSASDCDETGRSTSRDGVRARQCLKQITEQKESDVEE